MAISAPFDSESEADEAYHGDGGGGNNGGGSSEWGDPQESESLESGWVLIYQDALSGSGRRWFVVRTQQGTFQAIESTGDVYSGSGDEPLGSFPHYDGEDAAREAYQTWLDENGGGGGGGSGNWGQWNMARQEGNWYIFVRSHEQNDDQQFLASGVNSDGDEVYLGPDGTVRDSPHIYDSSGALTDALQAYQERRSNGETGGNGPTGTAPSVENVRNDAAQGASGGIVNTLGGPWMVLAIVAAIVVAVWYADERGWIELPEEISSIPDDVKAAISGGDA